MNKPALWPWLAALVSGVLLAMCFPGWDWPGMVWVWMLPLFPAIWRGRRKRYGFGIGYVAGLVFWLLNLKWLWTVSGLGAIAMAAFLALYFGFWGAIAVSVGNPWRQKKTAEKKPHQGSKIQEKILKKQAAQKGGGVLGGVLNESTRSLKFALINAASWVGIEWLRGWLFTGFGWNGLGVAFHDTPVLAQAADLVGVTGLAFLPVLMSAVIVQTVTRFKGELVSGKLRPRLDFSVAALMLAVQFCYGVWRVKDVGGWETERVRVLLIQENIPQDIKWDPKSVADILQGYADSTTAAVKEIEDANVALLRANMDGEVVEMKQPDLVIWPESAMPNPLLFIEGDTRHYLYGDTAHLLGNEIQPLGAFSVIAGMNLFEAYHSDGLVHWKEGGRQYNSIAVIAPGGALEESIQTYRKMHLVLFGEYIPLVDRLPFLGKLFKFSAGADFSGNFDAGTSTDPLTVTVGDGEVQLIPSVCFEDTVGRLTRQFVRQAPQVMVNVTNDGWFKESEAAAQHMANAKFRAIELRRPLVRCANTGVSGVVSATGSLMDPMTGARQVVEDAQGNHFVRGNLYGHAYAPVHGPVTLYAVAGDWFAMVMLAVVGFVMMRALFTRINEAT
ncbi:MAG: apolipoprotein N-acyltransferase [Verrucomicrobiae bacterium]|nr:apolipoprotein N-acyltransferase [Verrucomicrobiae bacterium]NNJ42604.1 apolipoprotein N-acyltransferase [Akkermansiaceae bacterium]